jgi:hypothetical protein
LQVIEGKVETTAETRVEILEGMLAELEMGAEVAGNS